VPVPLGARKIIDAMPRFDERILPYNSESVSASFERACKRLGIDDLRFHDLRHEGICRPFEAGLNIPEVALVSGHMSWQNLKRYTHLRPEAVLEKLDAGP
jgi:integrase